MSKRPASPISAIEHASLGLAALGLVMMLSFPAARSVSEAFGWLPFWLLALPLCAWAAARALRDRACRDNTRSKARPSASVHPIDASRIRARRDAAPQAVRRAA
jgi:hypothetical protein